MSAENGQEHKIAVACPCGEKFTTRMPEGEWINQLRCSLFVAPHERPFKCLGCGQVFVAAIAAGNVMWSAAPITAEDAEKLEVSRVLRPV